MTAEQGFLESIKESPGDDGLRLIFADWLEDHGQSQRAEFLRLQVELAPLPERHPRRRAGESCSSWATVPTNGARHLRPGSSSPGSPSPRGR